MLVQHYTSPRPAASQIVFEKAPATIFFLRIRQMMGLLAHIHTPSLITTFGEDLQADQAKSTVFEPLAVT